MRIPRLLVPLLVLALGAAASPAVVPAGPKAGAKPARSVSAPPQMTVPFLQDDYARAIAEARARKVPVFIEAWAPW